MRVDIFQLRYEFCSIDSPHHQALECGIVDALMPRGALTNYFERPCMPSAPHILIAEDHAAVRDLISTIAARTYPTGTITTVDNGAEALAVFQARGADIVITDYAMPIMTGLTLTQTLRAQQATVPILVISMNTSIAEEVLRAGANRFLPKPFGVREFQQALIDLLPP
jgi:two-component system, sensor histidine kinase